MNASNGQHHGKRPPAGPPNGPRAGPPNGPPAAGPPPDDGALLAAIRADPADAAPWTALLERHQGRLYSVCLRMVKDRETAADLTQDAMVRIISGLPTFDGRSSLVTWMIRVTMNVCLSHLRSAKLRRHQSLSGDVIGRVGHAEGGGEQEPADGEAPPGPRPPSSTPATAPGPGRKAPPSRGSRTSHGHLEQSREHSPHRGVELGERRRLVAEALAGLDPDQRAILVLRDVQGFEYDQIAATLAVPVGTVKSRLFRARLALRERIEHAQWDAREEAPGSDSGGGTGGIAAGGGRRP